MRCQRTAVRLCLVAVLIAAALPHAGDLLWGAAPARVAAAQAEEQDRETVVQELFTLNRRLDETQAELAGLEDRLGQVAAEQEEARAELERLKSDLQRRREQYGKRLRYYREQGNRGPWLLLFGSRSLADFLWRLDALEQIMAYDARLARELVAAQDAVAEQERALAEARAEAERLRESRLAQIAELEAAIAEREAILAGLGDERQEVETALAEVEADWRESALPVLEALGSALQEIGTAGFEPDEVRVSVFPPGAVVVISEASLNEYFQGYEQLADLEVSLVPDRFHLTGSFDEVPLRIEGGFQVQPGGRLRFEPTLMQVREFTVPDGAIDQIVDGGHLDIDVGPLVQPLTLNAIQVTDGLLTLRAALR